MQGVGESQGWAAQDGGCARLRPCLARAKQIQLDWEPLPSPEFT